MSIRKADLSDLDAMVEVALVAMPMDPQWDYRFPHRKHYPEDTLKFTRERFKMFLENESGEWHVMVAELPSRENPTVFKVAAFAVWRLPPSGEQVASDAEKAPVEQRRDADVERMRAFSESLGEARKHYFERVYGKNRMHLILLATHPEYQRRGAGGTLASWGMEKAKEDGLATTLFASPMGRQLYLRLGFRDLGAIKIQVDGETESICVGVMAYVPASDEA